MKTIMIVTLKKHPKSQSSKHGLNSTNFLVNNLCNLAALSSTLMRKLMALSGIFTFVRLLKNLDINTLSIHDISILKGFFLYLYNKRFYGR